VGQPYQAQVLARHFKLAAEGLRRQGQSFFLNETSQK
jgi:hypothetical protein